MARKAYRINFHRYLGALDRFLVRGQASQRGVSVHGHKVGLCVRDGFGSGGNRTTTFIHEREIVRDWSVGRFIAWSVRSGVGVCERVPNLLVRTRGGQSVLVGRARAPPRLHLCATLPSQEQRNNGTSSSRVRLARGERADRTRLLVRLVPVHPLKPCTSTEGSLKTVFQAPGFNSRLLVTAPWRTCSSVEAGPRPRSNALCRGTWVKGIRGKDPHGRVSVLSRMEVYVPRAAAPSNVEHVDTVYRVQRRPFRCGDVSIVSKRA